MEDDTTAALVRALSSLDPHERFQAAITLGNRGDRRALPALNEAIDAGDEDTRWDAEQALGQIVRANAQEDRIAELSAKLKGADEWEQLQAAEVLAKAGVEEGFQFLLHLLQIGRKSTRVMTGACLKEIGDPRAVEPLLEALQDDQRDVRRFAASALSVFADSRSVLPLVKALSDPEDGDTRKWAVQGLRNIGEPARASLLPLLDGEDAVLRELAAAALGKSGTEASFQILLSALAGPQASTAAYALVQTDDPRAVDALIEMLADDRDSVRSTAAWCLGEVGGLRAEAPLRARLTDPDQWVRKNAQEALERLGRGDRTLLA